MTKILMLLSIVLALCLAQAFAIGPSQSVYLQPFNKPMLLRGGSASHEHVMDGGNDIGDKDALGLDALLDDPAGFYSPGDEKTTEMFHRIDAKGSVNLSLCPR
jgi:hypothetical protein